MVVCRRNRRLEATSTGEVGANHEGSVGRNAGRQGRPCLGFVGLIDVAVSVVVLAVAAWFVAFGLSGKRPVRADPPRRGDVSNETGVVVHDVV